MFNRDFKGRFSRFSSFRLVCRVFFIRYSVILLLALCFLIILSSVAYHTALVHSPVRIVESVKIVEKARDLPPVLQRIAKCESGNKHTDSKGRVIINKNKDGSQDVGLFQINMLHHGLKAMQLGYNLTAEKDNIAFALWLYDNLGTEPWVHSKSCWNK